MRTLDVTVCASMSRLAWCVRLSPGGSTRALVGPWVDVGNEYLVEGCWNGDFSKADFDHTYSFMGSGVRLRDDDVVIVAPCHTTEAVYSLRDGSDLLFSNSIALILKVGNASLDLQYIDYEPDVISVSSGLDKYKRLVPLAGGRQLGIHYYTDIHVDSALSMRLRPKAQPGKFHSYEIYREFLRHELKGMCRNATDSRRLRQYPPIVFCSNGYDSSACAALGREIGCDEAVVFESKRGIRSDSGKAIVDTLGYRVVHEKQEKDYLEGNRAHLFAGTGELGTSVFFASAAQELSGKLLLSGVHGDKIWDKFGPRTNPTIVRSPYPDTARKEFRLATGYINAPLPFLAVARHEDLHAISNSPEMQTWSVNTDYDRPIPRRIVEEAGVPRDQFGMHKAGGAGSSMRFGTLKTLQSQMPAESFALFREYYGRRKGDRKTTPEWVLRAIVYLIFAGSTVLSRRGLRQAISLLKVAAWPMRFKCSPFAPSFLFPWAVHELQARQYEDAIL